MVLWYLFSFRWNLTFFISILILLGVDLFYFWMCKIFGWHNFFFMCVLFWFQFEIGFFWLIVVKKCFMLNFFLHAIITCCLFFVFRILNGNLQCFIFYADFSKCWSVDVLCFNLLCFASLSVMVLSLLVIWLFYENFVLSIILLFVVVFNLTRRLPLCQT